MRKIIVSNMVSLDGFFEGPNKELDWHDVDEEFNKYAIDLLNNVDTILFGRITYQMMAAYWPSQDAIKNDPVIAELMNSREKIIFSKTLDTPDWNNSRLIKENIAEEITKIKHQGGRDMVIFGSSTIVCFFAEQGLIDEYNIIVNPVVLGNGKSMFGYIHKKLKLKLLSTRTFNSGNVMLSYSNADRVADMK